MRHSPTTDSYLYPSIPPFSVLDSTYISAQELHILNLAHGAPFYEKSHLSLPPSLILPQRTAAQEDAWDCVFWRRVLTSLYEPKSSHCLSPCIGEAPSPTISIPCRTLAVSSSARCPSLSPVELRPITAVPAATRQRTTLPASSFFPKLETLLAGPCSSLVP